MRRLWRETGVMVLLRMSIGLWCQGRHGSSGGGGRPRSGRIGAQMSMRDGRRMLWLGTGGGVVLGILVIGSVTVTATAFLGRIADA